jgi:hypothetical protein
VIYRKTKRTEGARVLASDVDDEVRTKFIWKISRGNLALVPKPRCEDGITMGNLTVHRDIFL